MLQLAYPTHDFSTLSPYKLEILTENNFEMTNFNNSKTKKVSRAMNKMFCRMSKLFGYEKKKPRSSSEGFQMFRPNMEANAELKGYIF